MRIKALEDWDYVPEFGGNRTQKKEEQTIYSFRLLSGRQDMEIRANGGDSYPQSLIPVVKSVKNPPILVADDGKETVATVSDLSDRAELKGLFLELIVEYGNHFSLGGEEGKQ